MWYLFFGLIACIYENLKRIYVLNKINENFGGRFDYLTCVVMVYSMPSVVLLIKKTAMHLCSFQKDWKRMAGCKLKFNYL